MSEKSPSSSRPNQRKRAGVIAAALAGPLVLGACGGGGEQKPKPAVVTYAEANANLQRLATNHKDYRQVPKEVSAEIKSSLREATPAFTSHVAGLAEQLTTSNAGTYVVKENDSTKVYEIKTRINEDGEKVDDISVDARNEANTKGTDSDLTVTHKRNGSVDIYYNSRLTFKDGFNSFDNLTVHGDDVTVVSGYDSDGIATTRQDSSARLVKFNGNDFGRYSHPGPDLNFVVEGFSAATDLAQETYVAASTHPRVG